MVRKRGSAQGVMLILNKMPLRNGKSKDRAFPALAALAHDEPFGDTC
jgi:hypothetical protein